MYTVTYSCPQLPSMATTQPTPPPNPTWSTDNEESPLTTTHQPQEPMDPQRTINDNTNRDIQTDPATGSEGTGTELRVPTTSETIILRTSGDDISAAEIAATVLVVIVVIIIVSLTVVVIIAVLLKKHGKTTKGVTNKNVAVPTTTNQAYGFTHHDDCERVEENIYNYPEVDLGDSIEAKQNEAYATTTDIITEGNVVYAMNSDIFTEGQGDQAYANIATEKNAAYKSVTTVETVDEYDYI